MIPALVSRQPANLDFAPSRTLADLPSDVRFQLVKTLVPPDVTATHSPEWYREVTRFALGIDTAVLVPLMRQWANPLINQLTLEEERVLSMAADIMRHQAMTLPHQAGTRTVLMVAAQTGDPHLINRLLLPFSDHLLHTGFHDLPPQLKINATDDLGRTVMHYAVQADCSSSIHALAAAGGSVDAQDYYGWTPLHYASALNRQDMMHTLIDLQANPDVLDNQDFNSLAIAESFGNDAAADILADAGTSIDHPASGYSALHIAATDPDIEMARLLVELNHPIDSPDEFGRTPFFHAADRQDIKLMNLLIRAGANINAQDDCGLSALHLAVENRQIDTIMLLLTERAHLLTKDIDGETPYDIAQSNGDDDIADLFLSALNARQPQVQLASIGSAANQ
jgi:ankyrin repeat protein